MQTHPEIQDFTIQLGNLLYFRSNIELKMAIFHHVQEYLDLYCTRFDIKDKITIVDINLAQNQETIYYEEKI